MEYVYVDKTSGLIYGAITDSNKINIYNQSLALINILNTTFHSWFITEYNGMMAVGEEGSGGYIHFYQNDTIISTVTTMLLFHFYLMIIITS